MMSLSKLLTIIFTAITTPFFLAAILLGVLFPFVFADLLFDSEIHYSIKVYMSLCLIIFVIALYWDFPKLKSIRHWIHQKGKGIFWA